MKIEVDQLPEQLARALFEAFRLEIRYNTDTATVTCRVTLSGPTIAAASRAAHEAAVISLDDARQRREQRKQEKREQGSPAAADDPCSHPCGAPGRATYRRSRV